MRPAHIERSVIFDLDGTLVDSAPGILSSLSYVISKFNLRPARALDASLIGPPLPKLLSGLFPELSHASISSLSATFADHYDSIGCLSSAPYPGVVDLLSQLASSHCSLFLVTNKRIEPTLAIVEYLGWTAAFSSIAGCNSSGAVLPKSDSLSLLLARGTFIKDSVLYLGDTYSDFVACQTVSIPFAFAGWGYEPLADERLPGNVCRCSSPLDLLSCHLLNPPL